MPTRPIFDTTAVAVILKKMQNNIGLPMPWDNLCYCLLEAAWRTVADLVLYLCLLKSVVLARSWQQPNCRKKCSYVLFCPFPSRKYPKGLLNAKKGLSGTTGQTLVIKKAGNVIEPKKANWKGSTICSMMSKYLEETSIAIPYLHLNYRD